MARNRRDVESSRASAPGSHADPGWPEAWWWLGLPIATLLGIVAIFLVAPDFYRNWMIPEAHGALEIAHVVLPFAAFVVAARLFFYQSVKAWPLLRLAVAVFAIAGLYIAGEEMSWGQWYFRWATPDYWKSLNRQQETNLHNTSYYFNQLPQVILEIAIVVGGLVLPLSAGLRRMLRLPILQLLIPPLAIVPVSVLSASTKLLERSNEKGVLKWLDRPAETTETFFYMFILFYMIMLARRIRAGGAQARV